MIQKLARVLTGGHATALGVSRRVAGDVEAHGRYRPHAG